MVENLDIGADNGLEGGLVGLEIRDQNFDSNLRIQFSDPGNRFGKVIRAAVREVVPIYRGDNDVGEAEVLYNQRDVARLCRIDGEGFAFIDRTEATPPGTGIPKN